MDADINGEQEQGNGMDELSMEQLMESSLQSLKEGEVVHGTVVAVDSDEVLVDIGYKCEGSVPVAEFTDPETNEVEVKVNDEVEVYVERLDESEGRVRLSRDRAAKLKTWRAIEDAYKAGTPVKGQVLDRVKGGLSVDIGVRAFLPGSLVDLLPNRRLEDYLEQEVEARIISFDRRRSNVVLSRKAILEEAQGEIKEKTMETLEEGGLVNGVVKNLTDYGVFVDLGGLDGLLHITDISWGRVGHPSEYFKVGDEVDVVVLRFDRERERVSLGYKQRFEDPWILVPEKYPVGKRVDGKVVSIVDYGAFVVLEEGVEGLIHVSEMSWTKKVKNPRSILEIDEEVGVVVSEVDPDKRRLSLSLRATEPNPWEQVAETYSVGATIKGTVRNLTDFGAFVEIVPGVDGLVHISDMSWTRRINHPSEVVQKGDDVEAVITSVDSYNQRISLSMKELLPNEWEEYANSHGVGDVSTGKVTNVTDFGVFVELAPGVEGLCHISEIDRDEGLSLAEMFTAGQAVRCRILRVDWHESRIGLSMHSIEQEGAEDEATVEEPVETAAEDEAPTEDAATEEQVEAAAEDEAPTEDAATEEQVEAAAEDEAPTEDAATEEQVEAATEEEAPAEDATVEEEVEAAAEPVAEDEDKASEEEASIEVEAVAEDSDADLGEPEEEVEATAEPEGDIEEKKD
ncbi:MAG: S1 RNA-binding domain-containing protein [Acidobacteria bacterium]|nr:S1 RNA-binding domain-containing protein [Candidatus Sulfomarinibacter kjeldsenii]